MAQQLIVALVVLLAAVWIGAKYLPEAWRVRFVNRLSQGGSNAWLVRWLNTGASCGSGCSSCKSCDTTATPTAPAAGKHPVIQIHEKR